MTPNADVLPELASRESRLEHLINFLESAVLDLREVEVDPDRSEEARRAPNPACINVNCCNAEVENLGRLSLTIFWAPVECLGIDKVRRCERSEPSTRKRNSRRDSKSVRTQALRGDLAAGQPSVRCDHTVIAADVNDR
jgi:hypothetical protein